MAFVKIGSKDRLFVIDEIGKMELFSGKFVKGVQALFHPEPHPSATGSAVILATIPVTRQRSHWLVEELRHREDCLLFEVSDIIKSGLRYYTEEPLTR